MGVGAVWALFVLVVAAHAWTDPPGKAALLQLRSLLGNMQPRRLSRVSFKECNMDPGQRLDCGYYGIDEEGCYKRGCCWGELDTPDAPWCYHSKPTVHEKCMVNGDERIECGSYGIRKEQCLAKQCCWQPTNDNGVPWCYHYRHVELQPGECGVPAIPPNVRIPTSRIVGGQTAKPHSWPWQVSMQVEGRHFCGASIMNERWIISAAHCAGAWDYGMEVTMVVGAHDRNSNETSAYRQTIAVSEIFVHEGFTMQHLDNDIMLIKVAEPIQFNDGVSPICLPDADKRPKPGQRCYVSGWGTTMLHGSSPDLLQQVMVPVLAQKTCRDWYANPENWYSEDTSSVPAITDNMICAGYEEGGRGSCHGDSGGPFVCYSDDHWELRGIVSWGGPCAYERTPTAYARASQYLDWIQHIVNVNNK